MNDFEQQFIMNDFEWNDLENLKELGVRSISVESSCCDSITGLNGDEFNALRIPNGPKYNIELNVDSEGLERLQKALKVETRKPEEELKHELKVMHTVNECEGNNVSEKIDSYFEKVNNKAKACKMKNKAATIGSYKIKHR